ncbi:MAG: cytochrome C [Planctomycetaceae bacterium]|nr:cytochrome C [Planctomycetaceae bacterium]
MRNTLVLVIGMAVLAWSAAARCADKDTPDKKSPFGDIKKELPRVPGKSPEESRKLLEVHKGYHAELVASEPLIQDPVAIDIDEDGRMYVVQLPPYNGYIIDGFNQKGSIVRLVDSDGDGTYDKRTLFADNLKYPTAVACWDGGIFVGDAPDFLYMKDTNGDGKADIRKLIFTGFGADRAGEAHLNSIRWNFDNRFHFSTNLAGGEVSVAGSDKKVSVRGRGIIFDPRDLSKFELTSGGGQHGMSWDDWGRKFVCSNSVPAQTLMYDDRYVARNPYMQAPAAAIDIAPDGKFTKLYRITPPEPWRVLRTRLRREGKFRGSAEGGKPFGFFTGATGITIYRGDAWPKSDRGTLIVGDVANNLIYRAALIPAVNQIGLKAIRADSAKSEFVASRDIWFRPVQFAHAPDGTLYALDMCRELIEGAAFLPPEFFEHIDAVSGNDRGRIYRIAPEEFDRKRVAPPTLSKASTEELVALIEHPNGWHRDTASRLLYQRQDEKAVSLLRKLQATSESPLGRMTALHCLNGHGALREADVMAALTDDFPDVRIQGLRLSEKLAAESPAIRSEWTRMVNDPDGWVRYQLAFSIGAAPTAATLRSLSDLANGWGNDRWMQLAIQSSLSQGAEVVFRNLNDDVEFRRSASGRKFLITLASQIGAANRNSEVSVILQSLSRLQDQDKAFSEALVQALVAKQSGSSRERILAAAGGKAAAILASILADAKTKAVDEKAKIEDRVDAIRSLRLATFTDIEKLIAGLLKLSQPQPVQAAALDAVAEFNDDGVAKLLLMVWRELSPTLRARAAETLLSRPSWITALLTAVETGKVARGDLDPARIKLLQQHPNKQLASRVTKLFGSAKKSNRVEVVAKYQEALKLEGNIERGKQVFKKNCSACHRLEDVGTAVGADLKGIRQRGLASIMLNVLDPNREVKPKFLTYVLETEDGLQVTGMITAESANSITVRRADGTNVSVQRIDLDRMSSTGLSFMPDGLEKTVSVQAMADLLSYLNSID